MIPAWEVRLVLPSPVKSVVYSKYNAPLEILIFPPYTDEYMISDIWGDIFYRKRSISLEPWLKRNYFIFNLL